MEKQKVKVIEAYNTHDYYFDLNMYLKQGYKIITANIEGNRFMAVLVIDVNN